MMSNFTNNDLVEIIYNEGYIETIFKLINKKYNLDINVYKELKSYTFIIILEYDNVLLNQAYNKGYLFKLVYKIITNSLGKKSPFSKQMNGGLPITNKKEQLNINYDIEQDEYDYEADSLYEYRIKQIDNILNNTHYYYSTLFRLYMEGYSYKQIEELTDIKYQSVRQAIVKTIDEIKKKLK